MGDEVADRFWVVWGIGEECVGLVEISPNSGRCELVCGRSAVYVGSADAVM